MPKLAKGVKRLIDEGVEFVKAKTPLLDELDELDFSYRGGHTAPVDPEYHSPLYDVSERTYPDDIYGPRGQQYYGHGDPDLDPISFEVLQEVRGKPDAPVEMFRAVPKNAPDVISPGDWVTTNPIYAHEHGLGMDDYKILQGQTTARRLRTDGNSPHEYGYTGYATPASLSALAIGSGLAAATPSVMRAPQHPWLFDAVMGARDIERRLEGSPASLLFPDATVTYLERLAMGDKPNTEEKLSLLLDWL